jgi:hypothetical protein
MGSQWTDFHEIRCLSMFWKSFLKIQVSLKSSTNNGYFTWRPMYIYDNSHHILLRMRNVSGKYCVENQNTRFMLSNFFFLKIAPLRDNVQKYGRVRQATDCNIILRMHFACWITKATNTLSEYVMLTALPRQQWLRERAPILRYMYSACLVAL